MRGNDGASASPPLFGDEDALFAPRASAVEEISGGDPAEVRPPDSRAGSQAELNGPSGSPTSPPGPAVAVAEAALEEYADEIAADVAQESSGASPAVAPGDEQVWLGAKWLERYVVPIETLSLHGGEPSAGDLDATVRGLRELGQVNPVLVEDDGVTVAHRDWLVWAADRLGWKGIAVRLKTAEMAEDDVNQTSLLQEAELTGVAIDGFQREEADADALNEKSKEERPDWVGLPEFVPASEAEKLVISCKTKADRDACLDALGIRTIHKGTRGTLSVWFPDKERRDLSSLRFVDLFKEET